MSEMETEIAKVWVKTCIDCPNRKAIHGKLKDPSTWFYCAGDGRRIQESLLVGCMSYQEWQIRLDQIKMANLENVKRNLVKSYWEFQNHQAAAYELQAGYESEIHKRSEDTDKPMEKVE